MNAGMQMDQRLWLSRWTGNMGYAFGHYTCHGFSSGFHSAFQTLLVDLYCLLVSLCCARLPSRRSYPVTSPIETSGTLAMYEPLGLRNSEYADILSAIAQLHEKGFEYYRQRRFAKAARNFAKAKKLCEQETGLRISPKPSATLRQRCSRFIVRPPPRECVSLGEWEDWSMTTAGSW